MFSSEDLLRLIILALRDILSWNVDMLPLNTGVDMFLPMNALIDPFQAGREIQRVGLRLIIMALMLTVPLNSPAILKRSCR